MFVLFSTYARCKNKRFYFFYLFYKNAFFNVFYFLNVFYLLVAKFFILLNLLNSERKRLLSYGFNTVAIGNSLTKNHNYQTLSCTQRQLFYSRIFHLV